MGMKIILGTILILATACASGVPGAELMTISSLGEVDTFKCAIFADAWCSAATECGEVAADCYETVLVECCIGDHCPKSELSNLYSDQCYTEMAEFSCEQLEAGEIANACL